MYLSWIPVLRVPAVQLFSSIQPISIRVVRFIVRPPPMNNLNTLGTVIHVKKLAEQWDVSGRKMVFLWVQNVGHIPIFFVFVFPLTFMNDLKFWKDLCMKMHPGWFQKCSWNSSRAYCKCERQSFWQFADRRKHRRLFEIDHTFISVHLSRAVGTGEGGGMGCLRATVWRFCLKTSKNTSKIPKSPELNGSTPLPRALPSHDPISKVGGFGGSGRLQERSPQTHKVGASVCEKAPSKPCYCDYKSR